MEIVTNISCSLRDHYENESLASSTGISYSFPTDIIGTTSLIRRVVTATTTTAYMENEVPKVEVHISPATETIISPPPPPMRRDDDDFDGPQLDSTHIEVIATSAHRQHDFHGELLRDGYTDSRDFRLPGRYRNGKSLIALIHTPFYIQFVFVFQLNLACKSKVIALIQTPFYI